MHCRRITSTLAVLLLLLAPTVRAQAPLSFTDVTGDAGITFQYVDLGDLMGAGGGFIDYDGDGWQDILLAGGLDEIALYRNQHDGTFADVTVASGVSQIQAPPGLIMGAVCADYDGDGDTDIYVLVDGPNVLFENGGNGTFTDATAAAGVGDPSWTTAAAFCDFDRDGDLDLYCGNYVAVRNFPFHGPYPNALYRNDGGVFTDVAADLGVDGAGTTLAVSFTDYDQDGDPDLFVGNDFGAYVQPNRLYRNDGPDPTNPAGWSFTDVSSSSGAAVGIYCMGITGGDYDHDGDLDYYFSNLGRNVLLRTDGATFTDVTDAAGVACTFDPTDPLRFATSWGVGFHDFDQDGWVDLYVSNGHIPSAQSLSNGTNTPGCVYYNDGNGQTFTLLHQTAGLNDGQIGRACVFADWDRDGDMDVLQCNADGSPVLYRNDSPAQGHYLRIRPVGRISNREGLGARMRAEVPGTVHVRECNSCYSFEGSSEAVVHFGLGPHAEVDRLEIEWPSGVSHAVHHLAADVELPAVEPVLTVDRAASFAAPSVVHESGTLSLQVVVRNHEPVATAGSYGLEFRLQGARVATPLVPLVVPASGQVVLSFAFPAPAGVTGGVAFPVEILATVVDSGGGLDQWRADVTVAP